MPKIRKYALNEWRSEFYHSIRLLLISRFLITLILFGMVLLFLHGSTELRLLLILYGVFTVGYLISLYFWQFTQKEVNFKFLYSIQIFLEILLETGIIHFTGGATSSLTILFALTILSSAFVFKLLGTTLAATGAVLSYLILAYLGFKNIIPVYSSPLTEASQTNPEALFFIAYIQVCFLYIVAFLSGYLSQKLSTRLVILEKTKEELARVKWDTDQILQHLRVGLITLNYNGEIIYFNNAAGRILQIPTAKAIGKNFRGILDDRLFNLRELLNKKLSEGVEHLTLEMNIKDRSGKYFPIDISLDKLTIDSELKGIIISFEDIAEKKKKEKQIQRMKRSAAIGELSARLAHEIRNPLSTIRGGVEYLTQDSDIKKNDMRVLNLIVKESDRLTNFLEEFLLFARLKELKPEFLKEESANVNFELAEIISAINLKPITEKDIRIVNSLEPNVYVFCRKDHIHQIFMNLINNAIDAITNKGKITISFNGLIPGIIDSEQLLGIAVEDDGKGISSKDIDSIFDPFFSTKAMGTGLGLSIVQGIVNQYGGHVEIESELQKGTKVIFYLPLAKGSDTNYNRKK